MRINEVTSPLKKFMVTVNVKGTQARTMIDAESASQARLMLERQFGEKNVVAVSQLSLSEDADISITPSQIKHERIIRFLTQKLSRYANRLRPTRQDYEAAIERYMTKQKRVNLDFQKKQDHQQMRASNAKQRSQSKLQRRDKRPSTVCVA